MKIILVMSFVVKTKHKCRKFIAFKKYKKTRNMHKISILICP